MKEGQSYCLLLKDDAMFAEAVLTFFEKTGMNEDDNPKFFFNSQEIRIDSYKSLRELGIKNMSIIEVVLGNQVNNNLILSMNPSLYESDYIIPVGGVVNPIPIQGSLLNNSVYEEENRQLKEELDVYKNENNNLKEEIKNYILGNKLLNNQIAEANKIIDKYNKLNETLKRKEKENCLFKQQIK